MKKQKSRFPLEVKDGSVIVKIYKVENKRRVSLKDHDGISMVPKFKEKAGDIEIFTPLEIARFLTYSRPELVPFLAIGAFAGLRSAEIGRLDWSEVHLAERFIEVKAAKSKTASRRLVPMSENLAKWLAPNAKPEGRVVPFENVNKQIGWLVEDTNAGLNAAAKNDNKNPEPANELPPIFKPRGAENK